MSLPTLKTLTLNRTGTLKVRVDGSSHCGAPSSVVDGEVKVNYTVRLVVLRGSLTNGFIVDQERLHEYLTALAQHDGGWDGSCEELVSIWGGWLMVWVRNENPHCVIQSLDFTLAPMPHLGSFTATFNSL